MKRIALTDGTGSWFNQETATCINEATFHDGHNWISKATGSQWHHEALYRTMGGLWILNRWSDYQGSRESYEAISNVEAAAWLAKQGIEPHDDCKREYEELEIK